MTGAATNQAQEQTWQPQHVLMTLDAVGGVWRYALDLAASIREAGSAVTLLGFGPPADVAKAAEARRIANLLWYDLPLDWTAPDEAALGSIANVVANVADNRRIDLVHLNLPTQAYGLEIPMPLVVTSHSCVVTWFAAVRGSPVPKSMQWHARRNADGMRRADTVIAPSQSHASMLANAYGPIDGLEVIYNAIRPFSGDEGAKEEYVFAAGRWWDEGKNAAVLDEAARRTHWPVMMAGSTRGPAGQEVPLRHVRHLAEIPNNEARRHLSKAGIFVSPSIYEPFGLAALEAATAGAPLVLADNPTYRELWDGCALFADPNQPDAFAEAINRLCADERLRRQYGERARRRSRQFSQERQLRETLAAYAAANQRNQKQESNRRLAV